jgi:hypothetical protein
MNTLQATLDRQVAAVREHGSPELAELLSTRDGYAGLLHALPRAFPIVDMRRDVVQDVWHSCGLFYQLQGRLHEALAVYLQWYEQYLAYQAATTERIHKGGALVRISECHTNLGHPLLARRYLMLTTCEDALLHRGTIPAETTGVYFRMVWHHGMAHSELVRYAETMWELSQDNPEASRFPEWVVQHVDQKWITGYPSADEAGIYRVNVHYVQWLLQRFGQGTGRELEILAEYLLGAIPGCRTYRRKQSHSTDYDVVCALEGVDLDFRSELGRYFVCECKDWARPVDVTAFAKFGSVLDSVKARFGVLFSKEGVSGKGKNRDAEREQLKLFQRDGRAIVVVSFEDLERVAAGENFIAILRSKYEAVRLDLRPEARSSRSSRKRASARRT